MDIPVFVFPKYKYNKLDSNEWYIKFRSNFTDALVELLKEEGPLSEEWFLKRIAYFFGREKVTSVVRDEFSQYAHQAKRKGVVFSNKFMFLNNVSIKTFRISNPINLRKIEYVSLEELSYGLLEIIKINIKAEKNGIYSCLLKQLGINRLTDSAYDILNQALYLIRNQIIIDGDFVVYIE